MPLFLMYTTEATLEKFIRHTHTNPFALKWAIVNFLSLIHFFSQFILMSFKTYHKIGSISYVCVIFWMLNLCFIVTVWNRCDFFFVSSPSSILCSSFYRIENWYDGWMKGIIRLTECHSVKWFVKLKLRLLLSIILPRAMYTHDYFCTHAFHFKWMGERFS